MADELETAPAHSGGAPVSSARPRCCAFGCEVWDSGAQGRWAGSSARGRAAAGRFFFKGNHGSPRDAAAIGQEVPPLLNTYSYPRTANSHTILKSSKHSRSRQVRGARGWRRRGRCAEHAGALGRAHPRRLGVPPNQVQGAKGPPRVLLHRCGSIGHSHPAGHFAHARNDSLGLARRPAPCSRMLQVLARRCKPYDRRHGDAHVPYQRPE